MRERSSERSRAVRRHARNSSSPSDKPRDHHLMAQPNLDQLLEAGVHFGHQTRRWNPKMRRFIFAERNGIHIIDLQKTLRQLELAQKLAREVVLRGDNVMFVVDSKKERIAVSEGNKLGIPIVAIVDTNADPDQITVPIAGNDDAIRSVELVTKAIADAIAEARREAPVREEVEEGESYTYSSDRGAEPADEPDRKRKRRPRRRRAKPDAIAARMKGAPAEGAEGGAETEGGVEVETEAETAPTE